MQTCARRLTVTQWLESILLSRQLAISSILMENPITLLYTKMVLGFFQIADMELWQ